MGSERSDNKQCARRQKKRGPSWGATKRTFLDSEDLRRKDSHCPNGHLGKDLLRFAAGSGGSRVLVCVTLARDVVRRGVMRVCEAASCLSVLSGDGHSQRLTCVSVVTSGCSPFPICWGQGRAAISLIWGTRLK